MFVRTLKTADTLRSARASRARRLALMGALALVGACGDSGGVTGSSVGMPTDSNSASDGETEDTSDGTTAGPMTGASEVTDSTSNPDTDATTTDSTDTSNTTNNPGDPLEIHCDEPPEGAVGTNFEHFFQVSGGTPSYQWSYEDLPDGLLTDGVSGYVNGTPTLAGVYAIEITVTDVYDQVAVETCTVVINDKLSADLDALDGPCLKAGESMLDYMSGGNGEPIVCSVPGGKGNGVLPDGLTVDESDCTTQGTIAELTYGTWAWIVEAKQGDVSVYAPYCASQLLQGPQSYKIEGWHAGGDHLVPATGTFAPGEDIKFDGDMEPRFEVSGCDGPPCYHQTFASFSSSPFGTGECQDDADSCFGICPLVPDNNEPDGDKQLPCELMEGFAGLEHELWAKGGAVSEPFEDRVWISHQTIHYCMGDTQELCVGGIDVIKENGNNSNLEFAIIMRPE